MAKTMEDEESVLGVFCALSGLVCSLSVLQGMLQDEEFRLRIGNRRLSRRSFDEVIENFSPQEFRRSFRMDRNAFELLCVI